MSKSFWLASGRMRSSAKCIYKQPVCFQFIRHIVGPNRDDFDQRWRTGIVMGILCVLFTLIGDQTHNIS